MRTTLALWLAVLALALPAYAQDWPHFLGPDRNSFSPETGINKDWKANPPKILWRTSLADDGYAGPIVADGKVFIMDHNAKQELVRTIDLKTGTDAWAFTYDDNDRPDHGFGRGSPEFDDGKVYTFGRLGLLHCLDAKTGKMIWKRDMVADFKSKRPHWDFACSPVIDGNKLLLTPSGPNALLAALDKTDGKTLWAGGTDLASYATPVIATIGGQKQYVVISINVVGGYDAQDGKTLWQSPWLTKAQVNAATPVVFDDQVFITSGYGHGCSLLRIAQGQAQTVWENKEMQSHFSSPVYHQGHLYGTTDPGDLVCLEAATGKCLWREHGFEKGGLIVADGTIISLGGKTGDLIQVELSPTGYKELGRMLAPLGKQSWTAPILAHGMLIIRNKNELACLAMK